MAVHELFVYLRAKSAQQAVDFYRNVFGATEKFRLVEPSGRIGHVELELGGTTLMLSDEFPEFDIHAPDPQAPSSFVIHLHVDDADAMIATAVAAGARLVRAPQDHFRSEEHTSELQSLMRISYAVFCLKKKKYNDSSHVRIYTEKTL